LLFSLKLLGWQAGQLVLITGTKTRAARRGARFRKLTMRWSIADRRLHFSREIFLNDDSLWSIYSISHEEKDRVVYIDNHMIISCDFLYTIGYDRNARNLRSFSFPLFLYWRNLWKINHRASITAVYHIVLLK